jgi:hypothetical protein
MLGESTPAQAEPKETTRRTRVTSAWVTVSSFIAPLQTEADFEALVAADVARWHEAAREAGLNGEAHVRVAREGGEVMVEISPELDTAFTPVQTLWKAL